LLTKAIGHLDDLCCAAPPRNIGRSYLRSINSQITPTQNNWDDTVPRIRIFLPTLQP